MFVKCRLSGSRDSYPRNRSKLTREEVSKRFQEFANVASSFSRELFPSPSSLAASAESVDLNMKVAKVVFGKWGPEILIALYTTKKMGFEELRRHLKPISRRILSLKLKHLEKLEMVRRTVLVSRSPRVDYSLTVKGLLTAKLAEPFFLFLRLELSEKPTAGLMDARVAVRPVEVARVLSVSADS